MTPEFWDRFGAVPAEVQKLDYNKL
jgi:hypothetical protein